MPDEIVSQTANASEPAAPATAPEPQAATAESAPATDPNAQPTNTGNDGAGPVDEPKVKLSELTAQRKKRQEAEKRSEYWRGRAEANQATNPTEQPQAVKQPPKIEDFETYDQYEDAKIEYGIEQKLAKVQAQQQADSQQKNVGKGFAERVAKASSEIPDLEEVLNAPFQPFPTLNKTVTSAILESELGPQIIYHFHKNPAEGIRIANLPPLSAVREIGKLEAKLSVAPPKATIKTSQAPEPIQNTVSGKTSPENEISSLPTADYIAARNRELYGK
jgi:hypothetical protein